MSQPSNKKRPAAGSVGWIDLTVENASERRDFYAAVIGITTADAPMKDGDEEYADYVLNDAGGNAVAGVCHKRGGNSRFPSAWMVYFNVDDLDASMAAVTNGGGAIIVPAKSMGGYGRYCVIEDPGGATCALFEPE